MMPIIGPLGHEAVTIGTTAVGITSTAITNMPPGAAVITVEDASIRYAFDGTTPTSTIGHQADAGDVIELTTRDEVTKFLAVRIGEDSATLRVTAGVDWRPG